MNHGTKSDADSDGRFIKLKRIGQILIESRHISNYTLEIALEKQKTGDHQLGEILIGMGAVKAEDIIEAYAIQIGLLNQTLANG